MKTTHDAPEIFDELRDSGYQLTPQRRNVIERCLDMPGHFTAEDLQEPTGEHDEKDFSRATVYNTLKVLVEVGFLRELHDVGESSFYEINHDPHPHAQCKSCGKLIDVPVDLDREVDRWEVPFEIDNVRMTLEGYCEDCTTTDN